MFITRECDYAIRVVRELADGEKKAVQQICDKEMIPLPYGYKILKKLEKAGLVQSFRGAKGGYSLVRTPDTITLYDVLMAVNEEFFINECMRKDAFCERNGTDGQCGVHHELIRIQNQLIESLQEKSLSQIV